MSLSPAARVHIVGELRKLQAQGKVRKQGNLFFICCPFHNERTPSCRITTDQQSRFELGSFKCYGCGEHGDWNKLSAAVGLAPLNADHNVFSTAFEYDKEFYAKLTAADKYKSIASVLADLSLNEPTPLPEEGVWRTLPYEFLTSLDACFVKSKEYDTRYLFLPCTIKGKVVGGIRAAMTGSTAGIKYKNAPGSWSRSKGLYPYDRCAELMDKFQEAHGFRALVLVEGARDSLCLSIESFPTLGMLGTQSWCSAKLDNILDLDPDIIMMAMDGDSAGDDATAAITPQIRKFVPVVQANLTKAAQWLNKPNIDPGNAPENVLNRMWNALIEKRDAKYPSPPPIK